MRAGGAKGGVNTTVGQRSCRAGAPDRMLLRPVRGPAVLKATVERGGERDGSSSQPLASLG